jgi:hypothetical protein
MKERPILFSAPMVRAILDGSKTQTRRIVKPQPVSVKLPPRTAPEEWGDERIFWHRRGEDAARRQDAGHHQFYSAPSTQAKFVEDVCPYGEPGDRLWVRETWRDGNGHPHHETFYRATTIAPDPNWTWRPSIFMPRVRSRIALAVESIRVERLHDISEEDARAEGVAIDMPQPGGVLLRAMSHRHAFERLWCQINGPESWAANPWVWVVGFKRVSP